MPDRRGMKTSYTIDVVLLTALKDQLAVLLWRTPEEKEKWALPWRILPLMARWTRLAEGSPLPRWSYPSDKHVCAFGDEKRHPSKPRFLGVRRSRAAGTRPRGRCLAWFPLDELRPSPRHRAMLDSAVNIIRLRMDHSPLRSAPAPDLTLGELHHVRLLLGKRLHKASFLGRFKPPAGRANDEWRSEAPAARHAFPLCTRNDDPSAGIN